MNSENEVLLKISFVLQLAPEMRTEDHLSILTHYLEIKNYFPEITDSEVISEVSKHLSLLVLQKDELLYEKDARADKLYIIINGSIALFHQPPNEL